jgi:hypothetical protein
MIAEGCAQGLLLRRPADSSESNHYRELWGLIPKNAKSVRGDFFDMWYCHGWGRTDYAATAIYSGLTGESSPEVPIVFAIYTGIGGSPLSPLAHNLIKRMYDLVLYLELDENDYHYGDDDHLGSDDAWW